MNTNLTLPLYERVDASEVAPEIYVYLPQKQSTPTKAVVICGGGGYNQVNIEHEGRQFAQWLNSINVAGIVLNYRLPQGDRTKPEADLRQAVKIVRSHASQWNIDQQQIGAAGFSIGGHAVSLLAVKEEAESKLNFTMLFYGVVSMTDQLTHKPSRERLLGVSPTLDVLNCYSSENSISASTPPCLFMASDDDQVVSPLNGVIYYEKLKAHHVPASLHVFPCGGHGWGMKEDFLYHQEMLTIIDKWLNK